MTIDEILALDADKQIVLLTKDTPPVIQDYINQYEGEHTILKRQDKTVGTGTTARTVVSAKLVLKLQKKIVNSSVYFLAGAGTKLNLTNSETDDSITNAFDYFRSEWKRAKMDTFTKELIRRLLVETRVAELYYQVPQDIPDQPKFRFRVKLLCLKNGDEIWAHFDEFGDMDAFTRRYTLLTYDVTGAENKQVTVEIYTAAKLIQHIQGGAGYVTTSVPNPFGKIPVIYYEVDKPDWDDVQGLIDKMEDRFSKFDDTNDYFSSPAVKVSGKMSNAPDKAEVGKLFQMEENAEGKYGDVQYLTWDQTPEAMKLEMEMLREFIYSISDTPDLSFDRMKGMGTYSGAMLRFVFMAATQKAENNSDSVKEGIGRRINLLRTMLGKFDTKMDKGLQAAEIEMTFNNPLPVDENDIITNLIASHAEGIISRETAVNLHPYVEDGQLENEKLDEETGSGNSSGLTLEKTNPAVPAAPALPKTSTTETPAV